MRRECLRLSDPDMHHSTCVMHVPWCMPGSPNKGFLWSRWPVKRSRHSQRMRNSKFYVSGKRPMSKIFSNCEETPHMRRLFSWAKMWPSCSKQTEMTNWHAHIACQLEIIFIEVVTPYDIKELARHWSTQTIENLKLCDSLLINQSVVHFIQVSMCVNQKIQWSKTETRINDSTWLPGVSSFLILPKHEGLDYRRSRWITRHTSVTRVSLINEGRWLRSKIESAPSPTAKGWMVCVTQWK